MQHFDIQGIYLNVPQDKAFRFIASPDNLPMWTEAFASIEGQKAVMRTPEGSVEIDLYVQTSSECGVIDWRMVFPDGAEATAFSRVVEAGENSSVYSFVLMPPPVPLEQLEGALEAQSKILSGELVVLKSLLETDG